LKKLLNGFFMIVIGVPAKIETSLAHRNLRGVQRSVSTVAGNVGPT
jgi:hypothetical protein